MKNKLILLISVVLLLTIINVSAQEIFTRETKNDYTVEWFEIRNDITEKEYVVSIQNLQVASRTFGLSPFLQGTNFDSGKLDDSNIKIYQWKNITHTVQKKIELTEPTEFTTRIEDGTYKNGSIKYSFGKEIRDHTYRKIIFLQNSCVKTSFKFSCLGKVLHNYFGYKEHPYLHQKRLKIRK